MDQYQPLRFWISPAFDLDFAALVSVATPEPNFSVPCLFNVGVLKESGLPSSCHASSTLWVISSLFSSILRPNVQSLSFVLICIHQFGSPTNLTRLPIRKATFPDA